MKRLRIPEYPSSIYYIQLNFFYQIKNKTVNLWKKVSNSYWGNFDRNTKSIKFDTFCSNLKIGNKVHHPTSNSTLYCECFILYVNQNNYSDLKEYKFQINQQTMVKLRIDQNFSRSSFEDRQILLIVLHYRKIVISFSCQFDLKTSFLKDIFLFRQISFLRRIKALLQSPTNENLKKILTFKFMYGKGKFLIKSDALNMVSSC